MTLPRPTRRTLLRSLAFVAAAPKTALATFQTPAPGPRRFAILIGVTGYETEAKKKTGESPWCNLNTASDVWAMKRVLMQRFEFKNEDFLILLKTEDTTKAKILKAVADLTAKVQPSDIVYIHYSGHGHRMGAVQTLVPSDWFSASDPKDDLGKKHIKDEELAKAITALKNKLQTGDVTMRDPNKLISFTLSLDCCHSGHLLSGVRGIDGPRVRGRDLAKFPMPAAAEPAAPQTRGPVSQEGVLTRSLNDGARGFVAFLACRYDQQAAEVAATDMELESSAPDGARAMGFPTPTANMGYLTYFLVKGLAVATPRTTNADLFLDIQAGFAAKNPSQNPVMEGDKSNLLLKGVARRDPKHYEVTLTNTPGVYKVNAGRTDFISNGARFELYPVGSESFTEKKRLGIARVTKRELKSSQLVIESGDATTIKACWAIPLKLYGDQPLLVTLDPSPVRGRELIALSNLEKSQFTSVFTAMGQTGLADLSDRAKASLEILKVNGGFDLRYIDAQGAEGKISRIYRRSDPNDANIVAGREIPGPTIPAGSPEDMRDYLKEALERTARLQLFRDLTTLKNRREPYVENGLTRRPGVSAEVQLVPVKVKLRYPNKPEERDPNSPDYNPQIYQGDTGEDPVTKKDWKDNEWVAIRVRNTGTEECYVSIFDISPTGWVQGLYPEKGIPSKPLSTDGKWVYLSLDGPFQVTESRVTVFQISPPFGLDSLQVIATAGSEGAQDFSSLVDAEIYEAAGKTRGPNNIVAKAKERGGKSGEVEQALQHPIGRLFKSAGAGMRTLDPASKRTVSNTDINMFTFRVTK